MVRAQRPHTGFEALAVHLFRGHIVPHVVQEVGEIVQRRECIPVFGPERPFPLIVAPAQQRLGAREIPAFMERQSLLFEVRGIHHGRNRRRRLFRTPA
jgi:hypothetical protein